jgi:hypothetical protein
MKQKKLLTTNNPSHLVDNCKQTTQTKQKKSVKDLMLRQRLISAYKRTIANKELQKELEV